MRILAVDSTSFIARKVSDAQKASVGREPHRLTLYLQWSLALAELSILLVMATFAWFVLPAPPHSAIWMLIIAAATVGSIQLLTGYGLDRLIRPARAVTAGLVSALVFGLANGMWLSGLSGDWVGWLSVLTFATFGMSALMRWAYALWIQSKMTSGQLVRHVGLVIINSDNASPEALDLSVVDACLRREVSLPHQLHPIIKIALPSQENVQTWELVSAFEQAILVSRELAEANLDEIVLFAADGSAPADLSNQPHTAELLRALETLPHRTRLIIQSPDGHLRLQSLLDPPLDHAGLMLKRAMDIGIAGALMLLLSPLFVLTAGLIKLDSPGPIFFEQRRFGYRNRIFGLWKFRSMYIDQCDADASRLTSRNDPRVTRVGAFIRRTSIDELPQLLNVLKGHMSLVGPRPHPLSAKAGDRLYEDVVEHFGRRYRVKPGLTGLAQVSGLRGNTDTEAKLIRRFEADLDYVRNWSIRRDLMILLKTPWASLAGENAF